MDWGSRKSAGRDQVSSYITMGTFWILTFIPNIGGKGFVNPPRSLTQEHATLPTDIKGKTLQQLSTLVTLEKGEVHTSRVLE